MAPAASSTGITPARTVPASASGRHRANLPPGPRPRKRPDDRRSRNRPPPESSLPGKSKTKVGPPFLVALSTIDRDNSQNPRLDERDGIEEVKRGLQNLGGTPYKFPIVQKHDHPHGGIIWRVRMGHRTIAAARELKMETLECRELLGSLVDGLVDALVEQEGQKALTSYEVAAHLVRIRKAGNLSDAQLTKRLLDEGAPYSPGKVRRLLHFYDALNPAVVAHWRDGTKAIGALPEAPPLCTSDALDWLVTLKATEQEKAFAEMSRGTPWRALKEAGALARATGGKGRPTEEKAKQKKAVAVKPIDRVILVDELEVMVVKNPAARKLLSPAALAALAGVLEVLSGRSKVLRVGKKVIGAFQGPQFQSAAGVPWQREIVAKEVKLDDARLAKLKAEEAKRVAERKRMEAIWEKRPIWEKQHKDQVARAKKDALAAKKRDAKRR